MISWVYIFSKFTPEALLFEALAIFLLVCAYTAFWVLKKRRYGSIEANLPSGPVKSYLNELITNAEHIRLQLFGLLSSSEYNGSHSLLSGPGGGDPELAKKMAQLEIKMAEQAKTLELVSSEKARLEKELAGGAQSGTNISAAALSAAGPESAQLVQKIQELEGRLAEYSVIEDDLANLKRLQQENAQLKAQLSGKGGAPAAPPAQAATPASSESPAEATADTPTESSASEAPAAAETSAEHAPTEATAPEQPVPANPQDAGTDPFAGLAGKVEESLAPAEAASPLDQAAPEASAPTPEAAAVTDSASTPVTETNEGSNNAEADLVAEFEKMLKG